MSATFIFGDLNLGVIFLFVSMIKTITYQCIIIIIIKCLIICYAKTLLWLIKARWDSFDNTVAVNNST